MLNKAYRVPFKRVLPIWSDLGDLLNPANFQTFNLVFLSTLLSFELYIQAPTFFQVTEDESKALSSKVIVKGMPFSKSIVRLVLHGNISKADTELAAEKIKYVVENWDNKNWCNFSF